MSKHNRHLIIKTRLEEAFKPNILKVCDESDKHIGHAGYGGGSRHFAIEIQSDSFSQCSRVSAHRQIYTLFQDMIPDEIHALRITILKKDNQR